MGRVPLTGLLGLVASAALAEAPPSHEVTARQVSADAYQGRGNLPFADWSAPVLGHGSLTVTESRGDGGEVARTARLDVDWLSGADRYEMHLSSPAAGVPPAWIGLDRDVHGNTGLGSSALPRSHAAAAVWSQGTVTKNGELLIDRAQIEALALTAAPHAHDGTQRLLPRALPGNQELIVVALELPRSEEANGFLELTFDDVRIERDGLPVPPEASAELSNEQATIGPAQGVPYYAGGTYLVNPALQPQTPPAPTAAPSAATPGAPEATPGIPATPEALNVSPASPLPATPGATNAQPAAPLPAGVSPLNAQPGGISPANAAPAGR